MQFYGTKNDWEEYITNTELEKNKVSSIEELISNSYKPYVETATNALQKQNQYDISGAYKNYLNAQMAYKNSGINSDAYKNYYDKQNRASYQTNLDAINADFASGLQNLYSSVQSNIDKDVESYEKQIAEKAKTMSGFMQPMWATMYNATESGDNPYGFIEQSEDGKTYNLTKYGEETLFDVDDQGNRKFSELGKQLLASTLLGKDGSALEKYLESTGDMDAIENWQNYGSEFIQALVGKDNTYSWQSYEDILDREVLDKPVKESWDEYEANYENHMNNIDLSEVSKRFEQEMGKIIDQHPDEERWGDDYYRLEAIRDGGEISKEELQEVIDDYRETGDDTKLSYYLTPEQIKSIDALNYKGVPEISAAGTSNTSKVAWKTSGGMGSLGGGDNFSITFTDDPKTKYELEVEGSVTDDAIIKKLNKLSTGSEDKDPGNKGHFNFLGAGDFSSDDANLGKNLVVYKNKIYMFGGFGWQEIKTSSLSNNKDAEEFVKKYLGK